MSKEKDKKKLKDKKPKKSKPLSKSKGKKSKKTKQLPTTKIHIECDDPDRVKELIQEQFSNAISYSNSNDIYSSGSSGTNTTFEFVYAGNDFIRSTYDEGVNNQMNFSKLANVAALFAFGAAALGNVLFGHSGVELLGAGLFFHAGAELIEDVLS